ncbi:lipopolysaccharide biosynthesis protein [Kitasatospora purpeofusca]|uniref:lipopolysaccharide biosynthesis protein n=1 Tax=Kitasatospora purpeofusca TaxID=67352 RepID=UPI00380980F3
MASLLDHPRPRPRRRRRPMAATCPCPVAMPCDCSFRALLRARLRSVRAALPGGLPARARTDRRPADGGTAEGSADGRPRSDALMRNGHVLAASSIVAAGLGGFFWLLATRYYAVETVGRSYAALSAAMFLSTLGSLNLGDALVRFVPAAGRHTRSLVLRCYVISIGFSATVAVGFLLLIPVVAPDLAFLRGPVLAVAFVAATAGYSVFVLQDGALTGTRRTGWVLGENAVFAVTKTVLLAACAVLAVSSGIMLAWAAAMLISIGLANLVLFRRAVPSHEAAGPADAEPPQRVLRWAGADYLGNLFSFASYSVVPLMVLAQLGPEGSAYYSLAFVIAETLFVATFSMGHSLVVEGARDPHRLAEYARRMLRHTGLLLAGAVLVIVAGAPLILGVFGPAYAEHGTTVLRLMALCALPVAVINVVIQMARVRRALPWMIGVRVASSAMVITLVAVLLPRYGLTGVGLAWLIAEYVLAAGLLLVLRGWLRATDRTDTGPTDTERTDTERTGTDPTDTVRSGTEPTDKELADGGEPA